MSENTKPDQVLHFLHEIEPLKSVLRHSWLSSGRQESVPEHSWRMAIMAMLLEDQFPGVDIRRVMEISLIHDLGELYDGDIPAFLKEANQIEHHENEGKAVVKSVRHLPKPLQDKIIGLWKEYDTGATMEAKLAKALDKLEVLIQHNEADLSTWSPEEYGFNFTYGNKWTDFHAVTKALRELVNEEGKKKIAAAGKSPMIQDSSKNKGL